LTNRTAPDCLAAALADRYRIDRELGAGGMATVYLAHDLKHDRRVAVKVLRPELAAVIGAERFLREIKTIAHLQHPHILGLIDSGEVEGTAYYVMPFVEGESLRDRLTREKQLPIADAVRLATQVAGALDYAHRHGVIHRDIKPENILLHDGSALVADFGIALAVSSAGGNRMTETGMSLGTPNYMSPEQAMGEREITARSDVYALGCVTYEMLVGEPPFTGPTAQAIIAKVMTTEPASLAAQRKSVPPVVEGAVLTALEKLPADRFASAAGFAAALMGDAPAPRRRGPTGASAGHPRLATMLPIGAALAGGVAIGALLLGRASSARPEFGSATKVTYENTLEIQPALSPDGRFLAYAAGTGVATRLYVRQVSGGRPTRLTEDSTAIEVDPSWSPDGSRILFATQRGLFSVPASGGPPRQEAPSSGGIVSAAWSPDGKTIAYVTGDSIFLKPTGASPRLLTTSYSVTGCRWSPDGTRLACAAGNAYFTMVGQLFGNLASSWVEVVDVRTGTRTGVTDSVALNHSPAWSPDGRWLYFVSNRQGANDVYRIPSRGGGPIQRLTVGLDAQSISISADGRRLAYNVYHKVRNAWSLPFGPRPMSLRGATQMTRGSQSVETQRVSSDGRTLYYDSDLSGTAQLYRIPVTGGEAERLTSDGYQNFAGAPSPDGRTLAFHSTRSGTRDIYLMPLDGGPLTRLTTSDDQELLPTWSPDGSTIAYGTLSGTGGIRLIRRGADGGFGAPVERLGFGIAPKFSPDGRWMVFTSNPLDGRLFVVPTDSGPPRALVDSGGTRPPSVVFPAFSADGREVLFGGYDASGAAGIWAVPFPAGGKPELVLRYDDPTRLAFGPYWTLSRDRLFVLLQEAQSDIWVLETEGL
jgi:eukaryotic-like serine/threonine-protein kinase